MNVQYGIADLLWTTFAIAVGSALVLKSSLDVGIYVVSLMLLAWHVRGKSYSAIPGAALWVIFMWALLPSHADIAQLYSSTAWGGLFGASLNAMIRRYYLAGALALTVCVIALVIPVLWTA